MTRYLLDINVLIPLLWPRHTAQAKVNAWFRANAMTSFATCSLTQAGFLRLSSTQSLTGEQFKFREAHDLLLGLTQLPGHTFWPTVIDVFEAIRPVKHRMHGPKQITDAYLLGLARHHGGKLATLDKAIVSLAGPECGELIELID